METQEIASSIIPYESGKKALYLSYRVCNCSIRESTQLAKVTERAVRYWRENDENFARIDGEGLTVLRKQMANEYIDMEFTKNFRLLLQKDFEVLFKSITLGDDALTDKEHNYLLKMRSHYSPQNLAAIKQLLSGGTMEQPFDFTRLTLTLRKERETLEVKVEQ